MKISPKLLPILVGILAGCASDNGPVTPPHDNDYHAKYSEWTDRQLEMKIASDKRDLGRGVDDGNESMGAALFGKMARDDKQRELQDVESELIRRDPSGHLLEEANKM